MSFDTPIGKSLAYSLEAHCPGLSDKDIELVNETVEYYKGKYQKEQPWVTYEKELYATHKVILQVGKSREALKCNNEGYQLHVGESLQTNYLYQHA